MSGGALATLGTVLGIYILVVVSRANVDHPEEILEFLRENDLHYSQFIPCTEPTGECRVTSEHSITPAEYGEFMTRLFDAWVDHDDPSYYIRRVDNWLHQFFGLPPECCEYREDCGVRTLTLGSLIERATNTPLGSGR